MSAKIITIAQQKGGSGKTTLAANLAVAMALSKKPTAIMDTDPQGSLGQWFMHRTEASGEKGPGLGFRTASAWGARYEARELAKTHDRVIIDTPPKIGVDGRPAIEVADLVIVPVGPSPLDVWATESIIELARSEKKPVIAVLNRASERTRITAEMRSLLEDFGCLRAKTLIGNRILFAETSGTGKSVLEKRPNGPAADEIRSFLKEVEAQLKG